MYSEFFWSVLSLIRIEIQPKRGKILTKKFRVRTLFTHCIHCTDIFQGNTSHSDFFGYSHFKRQPHKWSNTLKQFFGNNRRTVVFDHFVGLALKALTYFFQFEIVFCFMHNIKKTKTNFLLPLKTVAMPGISPQH